MKLNFSLKLLLRNRLTNSQVTNLCKAFANNFATLDVPAAADTKYSKTQLSRNILIGALLKFGFLLMNTHVLMPLENKQS